MTPLFSQVRERLEILGEALEKEAAKSPGSFSGRIVFHKESAPIKRIGPVLYRFEEFASLLDRVPGYDLFFRSFWEGAPPDPKTGKFRRLSRRKARGKIWAKAKAKRLVLEVACLLPGSEGEKANRGKLEKAGFLQLSDRNQTEE